MLLLMPRYLFSAGSRIAAGTKVAFVALSFFDFGRIPKWIVEVFYPFTRLLWNDLFSWLQLPPITNLEKDALTALVFFLPLMLTSIFFPRSIKVSDYSTAEAVRYPFGSGPVEHSGQEETRTGDPQQSADERKVEIVTAIVMSALLVSLICYSLVTSLLSRLAQH